MKALVGVFYREKGLLSDCENFANGSFAALFSGMANVAELPRLAGSHGKEGSIMEPHSEAVAVSAAGSHATVSMRTLLCFMRIGLRTFVK